LLSSDEKKYGGNSDASEGTVYKAENNVITIEIPAFSGMYFEILN